MLSPETEKVLASLGRTLDVPYTVYNTMKLADIAFDPFTVDGKEYPLGYSLFEDNYELEADTGVRRAAFRAFYGTLKKYRNTTAAAYNARVGQEKTMADLRGFDSVFDSLLFEQKVRRLCSPGRGHHGSPVGDEGISRYDQRAEQESRRAH